MVELYLKATNQQVKVGDKIKIKVPTKTDFGEGTCEVVTTISPANIPLLINKEFLYAKERKSKAELKKKEIDLLTPQIVDILSDAVDKIALLFQKQAERLANGK